MIDLKLTSNGKFDNLKFPEIQGYAGEQFFEISIIDCDLNGPIFFDCKFNNCVFSNCNFSNARFFSDTTFAHCRFEKCDFRSVGMQNSGFDTCTFEKCDMRGTNLDNAKWRLSEIKNCNFRDISLHSWNWIDCKFSGILRGVKFIGKNNSKLKLDFSKSKFDCVEFFDCDISECIPPEAKNHYFINDVLGKIKNSDSVLDNKNPNVKKIVQRRLNGLSGMRQYIFNVESLRKVEDEEVADALMEVFSIKSV